MRSEIMLSRSVWLINSNNPFYTQHKAGLFYGVLLLIEIKKVRFIYLNLTFLHQITFINPLTDGNEEVYFSYERKVKIVFNAGAFTVFRFRISSVFSR